MAGVVGFALASALAGLAPTAGVLIAARALQGIGGAFMTTNSLALLRESYGPDAGRAVGLWTAFIEVIPYIGPWLSAVPPVIYALFVDPVGMIWVGLLFLFIYQVEGHVVVPNVMASALRLHPLLVIFGLLAGGELYGIAGVLVALPTMAGLRAIWGFFRGRVKLERWDEGGPDVPVEVELEPPRVEPPRAASGSG